MFTDQDLATLKEQMSRSHYSVGIRMVKAVVSRLEAAEKVITSDCHCHEKSADRCEVFMDWIRSKVDMLKAAPK